MATLTLKKSVNTDKVASAKGDSIFVERRRHVVLPGQNEIREAPKPVQTQKSAADEKLRAVLEAARARDEERRKREAEEEAQRRRVEQEIAREAEEYEGVKEQLRARETVAVESDEEPGTRNQESGSRTFTSTTRAKVEEEPQQNRRSKPTKTPNFSNRKISVRDIVMTGDSDEDIDVRGASRRRSEASLKRFRDKAKSMFKPVEKVAREVTLGDTIVVRDLANALAEKVGTVVKKLMEMGMMASQNQSIDADTAEIIATEFGANVRRIVVAPFAAELEREPNPEHLKPRQPVVTVVGHVDHGKTSLLDAFRDANVVSGEAGGITQHVSAYEVKSKSGKMITFLDTPGHETFTAMRARGAQVADIVVLVVAANDSVKPQTIEAINHIKAAKVPFIVAINKMDLPDADATKVRTDLLQHEIQVEQMGGDIQSVEISAKNKTNLDKLEEAILLQAELMELKADPDMPARAIVVEAKMEKGLGPTATILVRQGTLDIGDAFVVGTTFGRVRGLINSVGARVKSVMPGQPVVVLGLETVPLAGDELAELPTESDAREVAQYRQQQLREKTNAVKRSSLEDMFAKRDETKKMTLPIVLRADVQGSAEAIRDMLGKINSDKAGIDMLSVGVGQITEGDVRLAAASNAIIIAFNVRADGGVRELARQLYVEIRYYSIVYSITDDLRDILTGKLAPETRENFIGYADVIATFTVGKGTKVAGCRVTEGIIKRDAFVRLLRDNVVIYDGKIGMMKREKNEVKEVSSGVEFGMSFDKYNDIREGDRIECYEVEKISATL
ncbi:MAG: translation initiation factor IF-2 [Rickettsiales bacterium]|jgi:translation initiation factor IF-2|nr:translation initiation factor IF-2 [Rickettsiales bacterium]